MLSEYAKDQPAGFTNRIERVAIVGTGGSIGRHIAAELVKTGKHTVTGLTRTDSKNKLPEGVKPAYINYDDESTLVTALQGQQFLVITLPVKAPPDTQSKLLQAAVKAGVPYIMPNGYGSDFTNDALAKATRRGDVIRKSLQEIEATNVCSWITLVCGFWYEFSMARGEDCFGFDVKNKKLTLIDDGKTTINTSTWDQCGRAVAALLSLKELPDDPNDTSPTVSTWKNKPLYIASFTISQIDMFESWKRVTHEKDEEWMIGYETSEARYERGLERSEGGDRMGYVQALYTRQFYPNGDGNFGKKHGLANDILQLPREDLDECTKRAKEMVDSGYVYH
ncbi:NAD(P)-binding protein [Aspergillus sclerotioniger CBS 115572]|uniref:NAD(P)-binding protein n=1 Tax=Aspergillus sclerotioniger CBS 115572 TaxID=1450535 RepID=A0A317WJ51_9EURO|nr:NAD(P)-binding protein [Aspergillus sclerotioniger CBS 115572]PWY86476.1 NAD(P)-binding protein [Aspergillus sclerotioniger CBS 115572]